MGPESPQHIGASMAAANLVVVSQILTRDNISYPLLVSVGVFALTLPLNVCFYVLDDDFAAAQHGKPSARINILTARMIGLLALNFAGFNLLFFHFGIVPGLSFLATTLFLFHSILLRGDSGAGWRILRSVGTSLFRRLPATKVAEETPTK